MQGSVEVQIRKILFHAVGLGGSADVERAIRAEGAWVLIDARDDERLGGTGRAPSYELAAKVCAARPTILAGGLNAKTVGDAIDTCRPAGVDAASGLERSPGRKDPSKVAEFVTEARRAFARISDV